MIKKLQAVKDPTNGGKEIIEISVPYIANVQLEGISDMLFHRWNCENVEEQAATKKGAKGKKKDNIEAYVYRNDKGELCIPGEYLRMSCVNAAKFKQDPRSPRKSAMDIYKAALIPLTHLASLGIKDWDYLDKRRAVIQRAGINRIRPAIKCGWKASFDIQVNLPEYITSHDLYDTLSMAGKLIGIADQRPTFGRFQITRFDVRQVA